MFALDDIDECEKVRADVCQLKRALEGLRRQEAEARTRREDMEASIAKREALLTIMEMGWHYQNLPDSHVPEFKRYVPPPEAEVVPIETARASAKPAGLPTMVEMVRECLTEAGYPCRPVEVLAYIRAKWWPDANRAYVNTTLWNLAKEGRLVHTGSRYTLNGANGHAGGPMTLRRQMEEEKLGAAE
jgi:hypothetical protein